MKKKVLIAISIFVICFLPVSLLAQNSTEHIYKAVDFRNGIVGIRCSHCDEYYRTSFEGYINIKENDEWFNDALDVVDDGVINAKDYAKLCNDYPLPTTTSKTTTTSTTKRTTTSTTKTTTSLSQQTTDKDGYNNGVIAP